MRNYTDFQIFQKSFLWKIFACLDGRQSPLVWQVNVVSEPSLTPLTPFMPQWAGVRGVGGIDETYQFTVALD